jgi:exodeoxyribonuclease VII large subunit
MTESDRPRLQKILTISELNRLVSDVLTQSFPLFWISGEISNFTRAASGHWYFSLKDAQAQVRCVMFKGRNSYCDWQPREGDKVEARCTVSFYEARGEFQLNIEFLQRAGLGALFEAFEQLKNKLQKEGLFEATRKKPLPVFPKKIGIVTSPDAAALRDILITLKRRMPSIPVILYPTPVQGKGAAALIAKAIQTANERTECDVLLICRGGGSMEDLWQFNEEVVARAVANSNIPTISGVGHETDFTICDFVADVRAATPTAAAELVAPSREQLAQQLQNTQAQMIKMIRAQIQQRMQACDYLARRLVSPMQKIGHQRAMLAELGLRFQTRMQHQLNLKKQQVGSLQQNLLHLNPLAVLNRGYALVENVQGEIVKSIQQVTANDALNIQLSDGVISSNVQKVLTKPHSHKA